MKIANRSLVVVQDGKDVATVAMPSTPDTAKVTAAHDEAMSKVRDLIKGGAKAETLHISERVSMEVSQTHFIDMGPFGIVAAVMVG